MTMTTKAKPVRAAMRDLFAEVSEGALVGGADDLVRLVESGELKQMLAGKPASP